MRKARNSDSIVVSALHVRKRCMVIEKRGTPRAVLLSIRDYVRLSAPEPAVLKTLGIESKRRGTEKLTSAQIDGIIKRSRSQRKKP